MLIQGGKTIGLKVVTLDEGQEIGEVHDIIYDPKEQRVRAFLIDPGGWFSDAKVILFDDVKSIGNDAVIVESGNVLKKASDVGEKIAHIARDDTYLEKTKIVTEAGNNLGKVTDIFFDAETGRVEELEVSQGGLRDIESGRKRVKIKDIITVGKDATIVRSYTEEEFRKQAERKGLRGAVAKGGAQAKESLDDLKKNVSSATDEAYGETQKAVDQTRRLPEDKKTKRKIKQARTKAEDILDEAGRKLEEYDQKARKKIAEFEEDPNTKRTISSLRQSLSEVKEKIEDKLGETKADVVESRKRGALGKYLTKNIVLPSDEVLAKRGDMITNSLLYKAEDSGLLDQVLNNTSKEPENE
jgi:uncharacterized protein YrrD